MSGDKKNQKNAGENSGDKQWIGESVKKEPTGVAERQADRAAGREPLDARTGRPIDPDQGRMERPDLGGAGGGSKDRGLSGSAEDDVNDDEQT